MRHFKKIGDCTSLSSFIYSVQISAANTYLALLRVVSVDARHRLLCGARDATQGNVNVLPQIG